MVSSFPPLSLIRVWKLGLMPPPPPSQQTDVVCCALGFVFSISLVEKLRPGELRSSVSAHTGWMAWLCPLPAALAFSRPRGFARPLWARGRHPALDFQDSFGDQAAEAAHFCGYSVSYAPRFPRQLRRAEINAGRLL